MFGIGAQKTGADDMHSCQSQQQICRIVFCCVYTSGDAQQYAASGVPRDDLELRAHLQMSRFLALECGSEDLLHGALFSRNLCRYAIALDKCVLVFLLEM